MKAIHQCKTKNDKTDPDKFAALLKNSISPSRTRIRQEAWGLKV